MFLQTLTLIFCPFFALSKDNVLFQETCIYYFSIINLI